MIKSIFAVSFSLIVMLEVSLYGNSEKIMMPEKKMTIDKVIESIPYEIKGISCVKYTDGNWVAETVNISKNIASLPASSDSKFIKKQYVFNPKNKKFKQLGKAKFDNKEQLPPNYSSMKMAVESVIKKTKDSDILSIEYDDGSWKVKAVNGYLKNDKIDVDKVTNYIINPVNSVITASSSE